MVGKSDIVIDRFGNTNHTKLMSSLGGSRIKLRRSGHRIIVSDVKEITDVVGLEHFDCPIVVRLLFELKTARPQCGSGRDTEPANGLLRLRG